MQRALILAALLAAPITASTASPSASPSTRRPAGEVVSIRTEDDLTLAATFYAPLRGRSPAVVLVHDAGADRNQLQPIAERLHRAGFGVLSLDLRGHGGSKSARIDWQKLDEGGRSSLWQLAPRDVDAAARWILARTDIHSTNLSLVGYRAGCALVARHAERDENVICMALLSPKAQDFGFDVEKTIHKVNGLPTVVVDRRNDETERLVTEANALTAHPYIEFLVVAPKTPTVLEDKKTPSKVAKWMADTAVPKRGRR